jgi:hypothetical protein
MSSGVEVPEDLEQIVGDPQVLKRVAKIVLSHFVEGEARLKAEQVSRGCEPTRHCLVMVEAFVVPPV